MVDIAALRLLLMAVVRQNTIEAYEASRNPLISVRDHVDRHSQLGPRNSVSAPAIKRMTVRRSAVARTGTTTSSRCLRGALVPMMEATDFRDGDNPVVSHQWAEPSNLRSHPITPRDSKS